MPGNKYGEAGNGRGVQQNDLPRGARTASPSGNAPTIESKSLDGNGFGNYDPRYAGKDPMELSQDHMPKPQGSEWGVSGKEGGEDYSDPKAGDRATAYQHTGENFKSRSNPVNNDAPVSNRVNPYRNKVNKKWFGAVEDGLAGH